MTPQRPRYRVGTVAVSATACIRRAGQGRPVTAGTIYQAWCHDPNCPDQGLLVADWDPNAVHHVAAAHRHTPPARPTRTGCGCLLGLGSLALGLLAAIGTAVFVALTIRPPTP